MTREKTGIDTPTQILEAAILIFSEKGYHKTTIAEICQQAGTNIASVNYHFGDKKTLYVEAWREAFRHSIEKHPPGGKKTGGVSAEERLRQWITAFLGRIMDPACSDFDLINMEFAVPTGLLSQAIEESIEPMVNDLISILRGLMGEKISEEAVQLSVMSIHAQCLNPMIMNKRHESRHPGQSTSSPAPLKADMASIIEHVFLFSLGGIQAASRGYDLCKGRDEPEPR